MKALLVVDMQEDYIADKYKYQFLNKDEIIRNINERIKNAKEQVIYAKNVRKGDNSPLANKLSVISDLIFEKEKSSSFTNSNLINYLDAEKIDKIEILGIDGNCCVKSTALDAIKRGIKVIIALECIGFKNKERFEKTRC